GGPEDVDRADVGTDLAGDAADGVHDVGVALDHHEVIDSHRAVFADSSQIVAGQVHEHHVFRPLLGVSQQLFGELGVLFGSGAAPTGAGDRTGVGDPVPDAGHQFGR